MAICILVFVGAFLEASATAAAAAASSGARLSISASSRSSALAAQQAHKLGPPGLGLDALLDEEPEGGDGSSPSQPVWTGLSMLAPDPDLPPPSSQLAAGPLLSRAANSGKVAASLLAGRTRVHATVVQEGAAAAPPGAVADSEATDQTWAGHSVEVANARGDVAAAPTQPPMADEYDTVLDASSDPRGSSSPSFASSLLGQATDSAADVLTLEDMKRKKSGDVAAWSSLPQGDKLSSQRRGAAPRPRRVLRLLGRRSGDRVATKVQTHHQRSEAAVAEGPVMQQSQCMTFATWVKGQDMRGKPFVHMWKTTCQPSVNSGKASAKFSAMCSALGSTVEPFAYKDWNPTEVCAAVINMFHTSGVGASPMLG